MYFYDISVSLVVFFPSYIECLINHDLFQFFLCVLIDNKDKVIENVSYDRLKLFFFYEEQVELIHKLSVLSKYWVFLCAKFLLKLVQSISSDNAINFIVNFFQIICELFSSPLQFVVISIDGICVFYDGIHGHFIFGDPKCWLFQNPHCTDFVKGEKFTTNFFDLLVFFLQF